MKRRSKYARRARDRVYMDRVRSMPCIAGSIGGCFGRMEAHHAGLRHVNAIADDSTCVPLCQQHHRQFTDHTGPFKTWTRDERRAWQDEAITETRAVLGWQPQKETA
jgi:hypothetical protein